MNVKWAKTIVNVISIASLFEIFQMTLEKITQVIHQNIIQPNIIDKNEKTPHTTESQVIVHSNITHNITKNKAREVQSLNKLSHSKIKVNLLGAHIILNSESTATGSVADIRLQKSKQTKNGISKPIRGNIKYKIVAINVAEINNQKTAKAVMVFQFFITCL